MISHRLRLYLIPTRRPYSTTSQHLITQWRRLLAGEDVSEVQSLKKLLTTGLQTRRERVQDVIPGDIFSGFIHHYRSLKDEYQKRDFFLNLAEKLSIDANAIDAAIENWHQRKADVSHGKAASDKLFRAAQPLYSRLWQPLVQETSGLEFLVDMRGDLLGCIANHPAGAWPLRSMSEDIRLVLANWFTVGLLRLERVTWEGSSAAMLEMIAAEEKVHAIRGWRSLKHRLGNNRRVYVWTHTALPGKPLVALHIALCQHMVSSMDEILVGQNLQKDPNTAMFYSISSMKQGLAGVDLGNNLIKRAVRELLTEHPTLQTFATISPMPGFAAWLDLCLKVDPSSHATHDATSTECSMPLVLKREYDALLHALTPTLDNAAAYVEYTKYNQAKLLQSAIQHISPSQPRKQGCALNSVSLLDSALQGPLTRLGAWYLAKEKHRGRALDPVANFHLRNGACIARINYKADMSDAGVQRSYGLMVNYEYDMVLVEERNRKYVVDGLIDVSPSIEDLLAN